MLTLAFSEQWRHTYFSAYYLLCVASSLLSLVYIFEPAFWMLIWPVLSLQEYLDIAKKYSLHPVSLAIGLILPLSLYLRNIYSYMIINLCSFCNCCKFSLTPHDHMRLYELYKSVLDIMEVVVTFCATNHRIIEHCKFCPCRCTTVMNLTLQIPITRANHCPRDKGTLD